MADKSLGQHWLFDESALAAMCDAGRVAEGDTVLEIGPGLGTLTHQLLDRGANVIAVELDKSLAYDLEDKFRGRSFELRLQSITDFDFSTLPKGYKIVANIPYYLTSHLLRQICETENQPEIAALLVQKEVAERVTAIPGEMSLLAVSVQSYADSSLGMIVPAELFSPPPKVDSRILVLDFSAEKKPVDEKRFFQVVKAGFSQPRKKLRSSLAGGLGVSTEKAEKHLLSVNIDPDRRAQTLSIDEWANLTEHIGNA